METCRIRGCYDEVHYHYLGVCKACYSGLHYWRDRSAADKEHRIEQLGRLNGRMRSMVNTNVRS